MRRWLPILLLIALAAIAALAVLWHSRSGAPLALPSAGSPALAAARDAEPAFQTEPREVRTELAPAAAAPLAEAVTNAVADPAGAHLTLRVVGKTSHQPVSRVRVTLSLTTPEEGPRQTKNVNGSAGDLGNAPLTGDDGLVTFDLPAARELRVWARNEAGQSDDAGVEVPPLAVSERRELVLEVADGIDGRVYGRVVSTETGEAVAGAHVLLENTGAGFTISTGGKPIFNRGKPGSGGVVTGNDGVFELSCSLWQHPRVRVETDGYGMRYVDLDGLHADPVHALVVRVSRAALLTARVLDAAGAPIPEAWLELTTKGFELGYSEADEQGFFSSEGRRSFPPDEGWRAATGADGRARIEGLPPRVRIGWKLTKQGKLLRQEPDGLVLQPGEVKELEWRIGSGTIVHGLALDQGGKPVTGIEIWASNAMSDGRRCFLPYERDRVPLKTTTDAEGRFTFEDLAAGNWSIGPGAGRARSVAPIADSVQLADEPTRELTLHVFRDLFVRGRVISPTGEPVANARVEGSGAAGEYFEGVGSSRDGTFDYGPLAPGPLSLTADSFGKFAPSERVQATAGDTGVVLQLRQGGAIRGRVLDGVTGIPCAAQLFFVLEQGDSSAGGISSGMQTNTQPDGTFSREGFEAGKWSVTATTSDGRFAQQAHIEVGPASDSGRLEFRLSPGGKLRLMYKGAEPQIYVSICCEGALTQFRFSIESGKSVDYLAPAGSLVLETCKQRTGTEHKKSLELKAGETKEVTLTDED